MWELPYIINKLSEKFVHLLVFHAYIKLRQLNFSLQIDYINCNVHRNATGRQSIVTRPQLVPKNLQKYCCHARQHWHKPTVGVEECEEDNIFSTFLNIIFLNHCVTCVLILSYSHGWCSNSYTAGGGGGQKADIKP
jgi:hypothetical protein